MKKLTIFFLAHFFLVLTNPLISQITVTVTNTNDLVNGDITGLNSLINNPGPDGISFREALYASNNTIENKVIEFDQSITGETIFIDPENPDDVLIIIQDSLLIDGDINNDDIPSITIDGQFGTPNTPTGTGFSVAASNITIKNVRLINFHGVSIQICCPDETCGSKYFHSNNILNNIIENYYDNNWGIRVGAGGLFGSEHFPSLSDITFENINISGNTIISNDATIFIAPATGGGMNNVIDSLIISNNILTSFESGGIDFIVADVNSSYFNIPGPIIYSDNNTVTNLIISNNTIDAPNGTPIHIGVANYGNINNSLESVKVNNNTILNAHNFGIELHCSTAGINGRDTICRNSISNAEVKGNIIQNAIMGIMLCTSHAMGDSIALKGSYIENAVISNNSITNFQNQGIIIYTCYSELNSIKEDTLINFSLTGNYLQRNSNQNGVGIEVYGGAGFVANCRLQNIYISNNTIDSSYIGISLIGGINEGATGNIVEVELDNNTTVNNVIPLQVTNNVNGATNNLVILNLDTQSNIINPNNIKSRPNPFSTSITIEYELKQPEKVTLFIYNHFGQVVIQTQENQPQGKQQLIWNAERYADGIYYYRLQVGDAIANGKMVKVSK